MLLTQQTWYNSVNLTCSKSQRHIPSNQKHIRLTCFPILRFIVPLIDGKVCHIDLERVNGLMCNGYNALYTQRLLYKWWTLFLFRYNHLGQSLRISLLHVHSAPTCAMVWWRTSLNKHTTCTTISIISKEFVENIIISNYNLLILFLCVSTQLYTTAELYTMVWWRTVEPS